MIVGVFITYVKVRHLHLLSWFYVSVEYHLCSIVKLIWIYSMHNFSKEKKNFYV